MAGCAHAGQSMRGHSVFFVSSYAGEMWCYFAAIGLWVHEGVSYTRVVLALYPGRSGYHTWPHADGSWLSPTMIVLYSVDQCMGKAIIICGLWHWLLLYSR